MLLHLQNIILEMIARGDSLEATADRLCVEVEALAPGVICSVLTVDEKGLVHPLSAPSLPAAYSQALDGIEIGPNVGSCGTAAYLCKPITVVDIETDPLWADFKGLALPLGLRACWSSPICNGQGRVLGTFAFYYREPRGPSALDESIVNTCVHLCAIAIERDERVRERQRLAYVDALTGLANRASFNNAISALSCTRPGAWSLLIIDVDNLKVINDTFGHRIGDALLGSIAARLAGVCAPGRVFRLGGDEFAVIVEEDGAIGVESLAAAILDALAAPSECDGHIVLSTATIGEATVGARHASAEAVLQDADLALYHAKETARSHLVRYTPGLGTKIAHRFRMIRDVAEALDDDRVDAHYQPIVRLDTQDIVGLEALCRLTGKNGELLRASEFYDATSDMKVGSRLTRHMLARVAADARRWLDDGVPFRYVAVNVSSADFLGGKLNEHLTQAFERAGVPLDHVILEVTESVYLGQRERAVAREIQSLRGRGLRVALDDFGTGFASLTHLLTVPVDIIKIDKSFVDRLSQGSGSAAIVEGLLFIASKLGCDVVAEGIESEEQALQLHALGCKFGQGYYFSRAVDRLAATALLSGARLPQGAGERRANAREIRRAARAA